MLIPLGGKRGEGKFTIVDDEHSDLANYKWRIGTKGYAIRNDPNYKGRTIFLHRQLLGLAFGDKRQGDHINCNRLDNRMNNLRVVTLAQNSQNRQNLKKRPLMIRGVSWHKLKEKWRAQGEINGKNKHLGYFTDPIKAGEVAKAWRFKNMTHSVEV